MPTHVISANGITPDPETGDVDIVIKKRKVTLTDAQIKTLFSSPPTLVDAPGENKVIAYFGGWIVTKIGATPYSGTSVYFRIMYNGETNAAAALSETTMLQSDGQVQLSFLPPVAKANTTLLESLGGYVSDDIVNQPLKFIVESNEEEDFTGGEAGNSMEVTVFYSIVEL